MGEAILRVLWEEGRSPSALREALVGWSAGPDLRLERADSPGLWAAPDAAPCIARVAAADSRVLDALRELRGRGDATPCLLLVPPDAPDLLGRAGALDAVLLAAAPLRPALIRTALDELFGRAAAPAAAGHSPPSDARGANLAPAMLWRTDAAGEFTHFTRLWTEFTGRSEDKETGRGWLDGVHPEDRAAFESAFALALAQRRELRIDQRLRHVSGTYRWVRHCGVPQRAADGGFAGYNGSSFEITDLVESRAELEREVERRAAANRDLEELARSGSHDLQEPLRNLDYLLSRLGEAALPDAADELVEQSRAQVARLRELASALVHYASSGTGELDRVECEASASVEWAVTNLSERIEIPGRRVDVRPLPRVWADPLQLGRVFQNLIDNALRFGGEGPLRIVIGGERREPPLHGAAGEVVLWVRDDGPGIPPAQHEAVFGVFARLHGDEVPGTGIGLAISRKLVERHGGRIWVESEPGRGATFYFTLPDP